VSQVKIVTDSNAFLPDSNMATDLGIEVVPLTVRIGQHTYHEGVNIPHETFLRRLGQDARTVSVGAPSVGEMADLYRRLGHETDKLVCVHVSSALNDIADVALEATGGFLGRQRIIVLDSATTSAGQGLIVEAAARAAAQGAPQAEIVRIVRGMIPHIYALFFSDSLEYLETWGRLGRAQAFLGTMLDLKPLSTMEDGDLLPIEKVRNYVRAVDKLYDFIIEFSHIEQMYIVQHGFDAEAAQLLERLELIMPNREFPVIDYPPSLAVHIGPKAMGIIVYEGSR
jgi:DegV family protein with EDD domain